MEVNIEGRRKVKFQDNKEDVIQEGEEVEEDVENEDEENEDEENEDKENEDEENEEAEEEDDDEDEEEDKDKDDEEECNNVVSVGKRKSENKIPKVAKKFKTSNQVPRTVSDINAAILREIGGDISEGESEDSADEENGAAELKYEKSAENIKSSNSIKTGRFHHRLATVKDTETHTKISQALSKINQKKENDMEESEEGEEEEDSEDDDEDGSASDSGKLKI